jgi:hypothetical protein
MNPDRFLDPADARRAVETLKRLARHDVARFALTGGFAIEMQIAVRGGPTPVRPLHDIDFLVDSFDCIPPTLGAELLLRHVHPSDPPAKTLLQAVDPASSVRVDVFRAYGGEMDRTEAADLCGLSVRMISLLDLAARHARLCWDLIDGKPVAPKYARDFLRLVEWVDSDRVEAIWQEHRKPWFAASFAEAAREIREAIEWRSDLLVQPVYTTDVLKVCVRCSGSEAFPLVEPGVIVAHLGYC